MTYRIKFRDPFGEVHFLSFNHDGKTLTESFTDWESANNRIECLEAQDKLDGVENEYWIV